jgi:hypothetical protein
MAEKTDAAGAGTEWPRAFAQARGLERALALYPEAIAAAVVRAGQSLSPLPPEFSALTEPAAVFDPAAAPVRPMHRE